MVEQWRDIADEFTDALIVGNGGSRAVSESFAYGSLLDEAERKEFIDDPIRELFNRFETSDFEYILRMLWHAKTVNEALDIADDAVDTAYTTIQAALIQAVRSVHCSHDDAAPHFGNISRFMSSFKTVFSLNYDLIVYWALLHGNDVIDGHKFKDCFIRGHGFRQSWEGLRDPIGNERSVSLVFHPHGSLCLAINKVGKAFKIWNENGQDYLETIFAKWTERLRPPLIICDGNSSQKKQAILENKYLSTVYLDVLPTCGPTLTMYGWALGDQEEHILEQIGKGNYERLACSVRNPDSDDAEDYMEQVTRKLRRHGINNVTFFDASSPGCWCNEQDVAAVAE